MGLEEDKALAAEVKKKYDKESDTMMYTGFMAKIVSAIAITFSYLKYYVINAVKYGQSNHPKRNIVLKSYLVLACCLRLMKK